MRTCPVGWMTGEDLEGRPAPVLWVTGGDPAGNAAAPHMCCRRRRHQGEHRCRCGAAQSAGPQMFRCFVLRIDGRAWHWHWPRSGILSCPRPALTARDEKRQP
jgi:hypothetical protein